MTAKAAFGIVCMTALGCGGGGGIGLDQLPAARAQAVCAQNFKCNSAADLMNELGDMDKPITQPECVMNIQAEWFVTVSSISDGQAKGRVAYDQPKAEACIAAIKAMSCDDWNSGLKEPPECAQAFVAKVAVGGKCQTALECIDGVCVGADASTDPPTDGTCTAKASAGQACMSVDLVTDTCAEGNYCASDNTCVAKKAGGVACAGDNECGSGNCNDTTGECSGYVTCAVSGPATAKSTLISVAILGALVAFARRHRARTSRAAS
jgi:hypothetical protein